MPLTINMHFNWLPNSVRKNIPEPKVIIEPYNNQEYSGYYDSATATIVSIESEDIANILAHEHRHHQQWVLNQKAWPKYYKPLELDFYNDYLNSTIKYYRYQYWELDALIWSNKVAKCELSEYWQALTTNTKLVCS